MDEEQGDPKANWDKSFNLFEAVEGKASMCEEKYWAQVEATPVLFPVKKERTLQCLSVATDDSQRLD